VACVDADSTTTGEDGMCVAPPAVGAPCARAPDAPAALPFGHFCAEGAFCDQDDKCATLPAAGQLCGSARPGRCASRATAKRSGTSARRAAWPPHPARKASSAAPQPSPVSSQRSRAHPALRTPCVTWARAA
jgi:hypothetical protein